MGAVVSGGRGSRLVLAFPLLIVKNVQEPLGGGWLVNRLYLKDTKLRDFGWLLHYTSPPPAGWTATSLRAGSATSSTWRKAATRARNLFVTETGIKLRVNIHHTPLKLLAKLGTDFWGLRVGIRTVDLWDFDQIGYVVEFGAGSW